MKQTFAFSNALHRIAGSGSILTVIAVLSVSINTGTVAGAPEDEARKAAGMGVERVARLFTPVYESKRAKSDDESRWVQVDLGAERKIESVKLLPMVVWWNCQSQGFPVRFKLEASLDPNFGSATLIADCSQADYPDPVDAVATFTANSVQGRYVRLTASRLRQNQLALTKMIVLSGGKDVAEGGRVSDSESGDLGLNVLTRPPRPQGEYVVTDNPGNVIPPDRWKPVDYLAKAPLGGHWCRARGHRLGRDCRSLCRLPRAALRLSPPPEPLHSLLCGPTCRGPVGRHSQAVVASSASAGSQWRRRRRAVGCGPAPSS